MGLEVGVGVGRSPERDGHNQRVKARSEDRIETRRLRRDASAPSAVRRMVAAVVSGWAVGPAMLAASEIMTNAVKHGEPDSPDLVVATVSQQAGGVSVEVVGAGHFAPEKRERDGPGGYGLGIVDQIATAWGVEQLGRRVRVWFTLEATDPRRPD
jgi:serine/threonine-protein kinase RsbW